MSDEHTAAPPATPRATRRRRRRRAVSKTAVLKEFKQAAATAASTAPPTGLKPDEVTELDRVMQASGLLAANLAEAPVLAETAEETKAKLTRQERDQLSLAAALAREAEIQANDDGTDDAGDAFFIDPRIVPHGWHYEWRTDTVLNQRNPQYAVTLAKRGWRAVPLDRHPELMPSDWSGGNYITRGGQILMELPKATHDRLRDADKQKAQSVLENKLAQLSGKKPGERTFDRRGSTTRDFGAILTPGETGHMGIVKGGHVVNDGRTIPR